jgi:hypothetical protein
MNKYGTVLVVISFLLLVSCASSPNTMQLTSPALKNNDIVPAKFTCQGEDINPTLSWSDLPAGTVSLALIVDDPDAPAGTWTHWTIWNIDPALGGIKENTVPAGAVEGLTSWDNTGWQGPCPPSGSHRYYFKLYALDRALSLTPQATVQDLTLALKGHTLAEAQLMATYQKL